MRAAVRERDARKKRRKKRREKERKKCIYARRRERDREAARYVPGRSYSLILDPITV